MTRIVHVFSTFDAGGPEVRAVSVFNAMPDCEHVVIPMDGNIGAAPLLQPGSRARILQPPPEGRKKLWYGLTMRRFLRQLRPDLLVTYNWGAIDAVIASRTAPFFPVIHAEDGFLPDEAARRKLRRRLTRLVLLNTIHATIVPSHTLLEIARREYGVRASRLRFIPNGVDLARFRPRRELAWRRSLGVPDSALIVGSLGGLRAVKDLGTLLRAFARAVGGWEPSQTREAWLVIAGGGPEREPLESLARDLGIRARVVFAGPIHDPSICYPAFDVFAMSSFTEQMPIALLEAMASGLPAVVTDVGDCRILVGARPAAVAPPRDPDALAAKLASLLRDPSARARLGAENRVRAEREYSQERMLAAWVGLCREAMRALPSRYWVPASSPSSSAAV